MTHRRILITGATGGLGLALVKEARDRGHEVRAVGRSPEPPQALKNLGAEYAQRDLESAHSDFQTLLKGCDSVIHAAALSASWGPHAAFISANVTVTDRLLSAASKAGVQRFVFISSPSIYAGFEDRLGITEDQPGNPDPLNSYAQTKLQAERAVLSHRATGMACCAIRPRALVGEGDRVILPKLAQLAQRKRMPLPGGGRALIELTALPDAARAICEAEERALQIRGEAINISGGKPQTVRTVATRLAQALGTNPRLLSIPMPIARALASALEMAASITGTTDEPILTRYTLATLGFSQSFDLSKAQTLLDYAPQEDGLETLLAQARAMVVAPADKESTT